MPYDTRRKSLNLPMLGIQLPETHASKAAARLSPPSTTRTTTTTTTTTTTITATPISEQQNHSKKIKRFRTCSFSISPSPPKRVHLKYEHTPPPSPPSSVHDDVEDVKVEEIKPREIDLDEIKDEIVEGVIVQLLKTGNTPHLVKQLAIILSRSVKIVEQSANPSAIISSRLSTYLKRSSWSASSPCPVGKELETVHPRRTYFYLTTYPHQPIPDPSQFPQRTIISPSISSAESTSDGADGEGRRSLSPEVDLSSEEYDDDVSITPPTPTGSFAGRHERSVRNNRTSSPPLEKDEKEFTQTARGMQKRKFSGEALSKPSDLTDMPSNVSNTPMKSVESDPFFGEGRGLSVSNTGIFLNSPAMKPVLASKKSWDTTVETSHANWTPRWIGPLDWDMRSPETIDLDELDGMLDGF
ncbi:hypothetical protein SBOR_8303 [Sclerotinia borealis F-4128]|uniref:GDS1 winged helix domain-containing protein n=1 Tax=Sclerotinia borealis (strain F-4128) TaxID=1432307 RepID=W9C8Y7_SCLBF|nr:hypothetical protein SBOR_8303 [Sclerotinia borealis F-4128]